MFFLNPGLILLVESYADVELSPFGLKLAV